MQKKSGLLELIKQPSFFFLSFPLKSCKDEAFFVTLGMAFHTMEPLYRNPLSPKSVL